MTLTLLVVQACLGLPGGPATYAESFDTGPAGWYTQDLFEDGTIVATGGVDGGAYLRGERLGPFPTNVPFTFPASSALTGDLAERYGHRISVSYAGRSFDTDPIAGPSHHWIFSDRPGGVARWKKPVTEGFASWSLVRFVIDATWSDDEAEQRGWTRFSSDDGTKSWADTIRDVTSQAFYTGDCPSHCGTRWIQVIGLDAIVVTRACGGDTNGDDTVDVDDLNNVILDWNTDGTAHGGDVTGSPPGTPPDGIVDVNDLVAVAVDWGPCP